MRMNRFIHKLTAAVLLLLCATGLAACDPDVEPEPDSISVNPTNYTFGDRAGETVSINVTANTAWNVTSSADWIRISTSQGNSGTTVVNVTTTNNNPGETRTTELVFVAGSATQRVALTQTGAEDDCYAEPINVLNMAYSILCDFKCGRNTQYFYAALCGEGYIQSKTDEEMIAEITSSGSDSEGNSWTRNIPSDNSPNYWTGLSTKSKYYLVTIPYASNGKHGRIVKTEINTKSRIDQPLVEIENVSAYLDYYTWETAKNNYCDQYYTFAVASSNAHLPLLWLAETENADYLAFLVKKEIDKNSATHTTNICGVGTAGREKLYGKQLNNATGDNNLNIQRDYYNDKYLQLFTWGTNRNGELSSLVTSHAYNVEASSESGYRMSRITPTPHRQSKPVDMTKPIPGIVITPEMRESIMITRIH